MVNRKSFHTFAGMKTIRLIGVAVLMALLQAEALFGYRDVSRNVSENNDTLGDVSGNVSTISPIMDDDFFDEHANLSISPELEHTAAYYASKKQYDKAARAALYSGFVQQYYNDNASAMLSYKDAEYYGELVGDSLTVAHAQYRVGKLLYKEDLAKEALDILQFSDSNFGNHYANKSIVQNTIAVCFLLQGDIDNAETCLQQSIIYARKCHLNKVKRKALNNYAVLYQIMGNYDQAVLCLRQVGVEPDLDDNELLMLNINMGDIFVESNMIDSAAFYYRIVDSLLPESRAKTETKVSAYRSLSLFAEKQGDTMKALRYREKHEGLVYDYMIQRQEQAVFHVQKQYDYETMQNRMNQKLSRTKNIIAIITVLFLGVVVLYRAVQRNKKEAETKANLLRFMNQNLELTQQQEALQKTHQDIARKLFEAQFKDALTMQRLSIFLDNKGDTVLLTNLKQTVFNDQEPWDAMLDLFDEMYPTLREKLQQQYPNLTEMELKDVVLSYYNISRDEEALLFKKSVHTIDKWRNNVRKKMGNKLKT